MTEINPLPDCLSHLRQMMPRQKQIDIMWNVAIEQAALVVDEANREGPYQAIGAASEIRRMKRPIHD